MVHIRSQPKPIQLINYNIRWAQSSKFACVIYIYISISLRAH